MAQRVRQILGWVAVAVSTVMTCLWAFWGIIENFHEGWHYPWLLMNLGLMTAQYLLPMLLFMGMTLVSLRWPRVGAALHVLAAVGAAWFFRGAPWTVFVPFIAGPLLLLGIGYGCGRPEPRRWAVAAIIGLPLATLAVCGIEPAIRVASRLDDGDRSARRVAGNGVDLIWAPEGPGWPCEGVSWDEAVRRCRYLTADGTASADTPQDIWRLPTVDEVVRSMQRHGQNCGGTWDATAGRVSYWRTPDKESPLWDIHSQVIYWWTATEVSDRDAYIIVYNGQVWPRPKRARWGYLGFRAVRTESEAAKRLGPDRSLKLTAVATSVSRAMAPSQMAVAPELSR
jgi:hypothetical protein